MAIPEIQKTLVLIKPDGVQRRLIGRIQTRFEDLGLKVHALSLRQASRELAEEHYAEHAEKPFYPRVIEYLTSGPVVAMVLSGLNAVGKVRQVVGDTEPAAALPGTIRGDWAHEPMIPGDIYLCNLIHASATTEEAEREIGLWFRPDDILDYPLPDDRFHGR